MLKCDYKELASKEKPGEPTTAETYRAFSKRNHNCPIDKEQAEKLFELRKEYERYSELSEIEEKKVKAIINQLDITLGDDRRRGTLFDIIIKVVGRLIFFFMIGLTLFLDSTR